MNYELSYRSEENHIFIPEWENRDIKQMPEYVYVIEEHKDEYYFEIEIGSTWDDKFAEAIVRKVIGEGENEQLVQMTEEEIAIVLEYLEKTCF